MASFSNILAGLGRGIQGVNSGLFPIQGIAGPVQDPNAPPDPEQQALQQRAKAIQNNALLTLGLGLLAGKGQGQRFGPAAFQALQAAQGGFGQQMTGLQNEQYRSDVLKQKKAEAETRAKIAEQAAADRQAGLQIQRDALTQRTAQQDAMLKQQAELAAQRMAIEKAGLGQRADLTREQIQAQRDIANAKLAQSGAIQGAKQRALDETKAEQISGMLQSTALTRQALGDAIKLAKNESLTTGFGGAMMRKLPGGGAGTDALSLKEAIDTVRANFSVTQINAMRAQSKTGGAVGQVTEKEWDRLANTVTNLNPDQKKEVLLKNLQRAQEHLDKLDKLGAFQRLKMASAITQGGFGQGATPGDGPQVGSPADIQATKSIGGRDYIQIGGKWYENQ